MAANVCLRLPAVTSVRAEEEIPNSSSTHGQHRLYLNKPSWIVTTQCSAKTKTKRKEKGRCVVCHGTGRVDCFNCNGKGAGAVEVVDYVIALAVLVLESTDTLWVSVS
ncbi:hypothetical protein AALP_AA3G200300 [Arabis alpina]|uniref:Uncharacterized protein n=1 Tax=Arabis alpina TaxID=50452 RepID=A0A087HAE1_ARAAL|nr:hypothetical protein AALP_AA3G200300 [Arabis alpina]